MLEKELALAIKEQIKHSTEPQLLAIIGDYESGFVKELTGLIFIGEWNPYYHQYMQAKDKYNFIRILKK